jgi:2-polyprenyl-3-methyl-5-hydroxy-6-metoxy-1,4-benzoquinol methylase
MLKLPTDREIAKLAWSLYDHAPVSVRLLASARTYICPMQPLLAEVPMNSTVFDIGCGSGLFLSLLVANRQVVEAIGIDLNVKALQSAKSAMLKLASNNPKISVDFIMASDVNQWPETHFSVVSMIDVMHHIPPKKQRYIFESAVSRVSPGGYLLYKDMCHKPFWKATANQLHDLVLARQWIHSVPMDRVKQWGLSLGLQLFNESNYSVIAYGHEKLVFKKP